MPKPNEWIFPVFTDHDSYDRSMEKLSDLHLYTGSKCNRQCSFCIVSGRPDGWYQPLTTEVLEAALALVPADATLKFYGGEPTIDLENLLWAMRYLRERGFRGWLTVFSNGVLAERVLAILEADACTDVVLNYSILHGEDADPIPPDSLAQLKDYARTHPNRIYSSHAGVFPYGRGLEFAEEVGSLHVLDRMHASVEKKIETGILDPGVARQMEEKDYRVCPRCRPVVGTDGRHHACPFAVESRMPHFDLGPVSESATTVLARFQRFLDWIDETLEPEAERLKVHPCVVCTQGLTNLPTYDIPVESAVKK